ncbi:Uncharacterised protein [Legionella pneumophila]|uniref:TIGR04255 family protein n=1 Tax=Legionella pneumophila TaxID=446 RepID=UPI0005CAE66E|nr:TIGR04255 family protein [Legionella pneumophila]HAT8828283.1 TIGR04255 family protein [Legionella pneumophila subsp. pneumophila]WAI79403.1 TIGR04255 family protein [Legionella pneumophila]CZH22141.1 Uncharacterised protein [Legionella pneumophila]CZI46173.1 Uncharacterised protein [Legionella pneumophila]HAT4693293.1 TIGR04255 family protein [Legionella pneumophila]
MNKAIPKKLNVEPLVEAVFEIRFQGSSLASNALLGYLISKLGNLSLTRLPASDIPQLLREQNPNFKYLPLFKASWKEYSILIGDWMCAITTNIPYPGWDNFKATIMELAEYLENSKLISKVERYSLKYVDILEAEKTQEQLDLIKFQIQLGDYDIKKEPINLRIELSENHFLHVVQIISNSILEERGKTIKKGLLINIDSLVNNPTNNFWNSLSESLEEIHTASKNLFFNFLKKETITSLEPIYET